MIRKIVEAKDPILRKKARPILKIDKKIRQLGNDLIDTLATQKEPEGVGLAACQIGKSVRMFAMVNGKKIKLIINPKIISIQKKAKILQVKGLATQSQTKSKTKDKKGRKNQEKIILEGCLSIPYFYGPLKRPQKLTLKYLDIASGKEKLETFEGFPAQIVQHEVDHLEGVLFTDKLLKQKKPLYKHDPKTKEFEEVELI